MAENSPPYSQKSSFSVGTLLLYMVVMAAAGAIGYNYYVKNVQGYTIDPEEVTLRYVDSDFKVNIDDENALAIISNPRRYQREFDNLVFQINSQLVKHTANRMGLPDTLKRRALTEYKSIHPSIKDLYFKDFVTLKDTTSQLYQEWYNNEFKNATDAMNIVASKYTCFFINKVFDTVLKTKEGTVFIKGKKIDTPCGIALTEALGPMIERMKKRAAIDDFTTSKGMLEERVEKAIAELATMEVRDKKGLTKQLQTKVFGFAVSSTDVEVSAISQMKVGFKLDRYFDLKLSEKRRQVIVTLPEPEILSHEVYPKFDKLDVGWLREVENMELNNNINALRAAFREDAFESDVFDKSKAQVAGLMELLLMPVVSQLNGAYKLVVKFKDTDLQPLDSPIIKEGKSKVSSAGLIELEN